MGVLYCAMLCSLSPTSKHLTSSVQAYQEGAFSISRGAALEYRLPRDLVIVISGEHFPESAD